MYQFSTMSHVFFTKCSTNSNKFAQISYHFPQISTNVHKFKHSWPIPLDKFVPIDRLLIGNLFHFSVGWNQEKRILSLNTQSRLSVGGQFGLRVSNWIRSDWVKLHRILYDFIAFNKKRRGTTKGIIFLLNLVQYPSREVKKKKKSLLKLSLVVTASKIGLKSGFLPLYLILPKSTNLR